MYMKAFLLRLIKAWEGTSNKREEGKGAIIGKRKEQMSSEIEATKDKGRPLLSPGFSCLGSAPLGKGPSCGWHGLFPALLAGEREPCFRFGRLQSIRREEGEPAFSDEAKTPGRRPLRTLACSSSEAGFCESWLSFLHPLGKFLQSCDPTDCSPPGSSVRGISPARRLAWVPISSSRGSCPPRDQKLGSLPLTHLANLWTIANQAERTQRQPCLWKLWRVRGMQADSWRVCRWLIWRLPQYSLEPAPPDP